VEREIMLLKILITQMSGRLEKEHILVTKFMETMKFHPEKQEINSQRTFTGW
jgi:hypothetical protein